MYESTLQKFEQIERNMFDCDTPESIATVTLDLASVAMQFSRVERVPRYMDGGRESDVEHSFMLSLVATELCKMLELDLDAGLVSQYGIVHDLVELRTADVATFIISDSQLEQKHQAEKRALCELMRTLPPHTAQLLFDYESQADKEARFVKLVDKLLPIIIDIIGQGDRVMREDYDVHTDAQLTQAHEALRVRIASAFGDEFPDVVLAHGILTRMFEDVYGAA